MKPETLQKIDSLKGSPELTDTLDLFVEQVNAAVSLFSKCEVHPGLHTFMNMYSLRNQINKVLQPTLEKFLIYAPGNEKKMLMDSIFDEAIDDIVENGFSHCISYLGEGSN